MDMFTDPNVLFSRTFIHFKDVAMLVKYADEFIAFERAVYMKDYGLCFVDAQACAQYEYDTKLETMKASFNDADDKAAKYRSVHDHLGQPFPSVGHMCKHWHIQPFAYNRRRALGWSIQESLCGRDAPRGKE